MKLREGECRNCGITDWLQLGFVPSTVFEETDEGHWSKAELCTSCGETRTIAPTQDQIERAIEGYLEIMDEYELLTEEESELLRG